MKNSKKTGTAAYSLLHALEHLMADTNRLVVWPPTSMMSAPSLTKQNELS